MKKTMAQGVLSALNTAEKATLLTAVTAIHDAAAAVIALGYPAYSAYAETVEKEILFSDKLVQIHDLAASLMTGCVSPTLLIREKL
jgi:hypothetical protein